jgi:tellurite resistance protein TerC
VLTTWVAFHVVVLVALGLDLAFSGTRPAVWTAGWVALALGFGVWLRATLGNAAALAYVTCYLIELSLSADNLIVMLYIFTSRNVAERDQHRMLLWGVLGAIVMRGAFVLLGTTLLERLAWVSYVFAAILLWAGIRLAIGKSHRPPAKTVGGVPVFLATLLLVESADVVFAVDSVPAAFAVTRDPFLIYTANILAVIGLRSLYGLIASSVSRVRYLDRGLAAILIFVGFGLVVPVPPAVTLGVVITLLALTAALSALSLRRRPDV